MSAYPYADRFAINRTLPEKGMTRDEVLEQLHVMASEEDTSWEGGKVSGTMYCGDHDHYNYMNEAFGLFAHVNVLQRDICPSATKFEAEIISMVLDLHHGDAATAAGDDPCGLVTSGGTGSISQWSSDGRRLIRSPPRLTWIGCATTLTTRRWRWWARPVTTATAPWIPLTS
jgi:sphinganine-1-phosphate aldolase